MLAFSNDYYGMIFRATQSVELFCAYLVLTELNDLTDFSDKCNQVFTINGSSNTSFLTEEQFLRIFGDGKEYLMIPHYDKSPKLNLSKVPNIRENISCGEVTSAKKFLSMKKNQDELVPVLFGDIRVSDPIHEKLIDKHI